MVGGGCVKVCGSKVGIIRAFILMYVCPCINRTRTYYSGFSFFMFESHL